MTDRETMIADIPRRHPAAADDVDAILAMPRSDAVSEWLHDLEKIAGMDLLALASGLEDNLCHRYCACPRERNTPKDCIQVRAADVFRALSQKAKP